MPVLFRKSWLRAVLLGCWAALAAGCLPQENDKPANQTAAGSDAAQNASAQAAAEQEEAVIGDLGGQPVRLPRYVDLVQYDDSPGFDLERLRDYRPPKRTFDSKLMSFGYYYNYETDELKDDSNFQRYREDESKPASKWVSVGITSGRMYRFDWKVWDDGVRWTLEHGWSLKRPYTKLPEKQHGLDVYVQLGTDPKTRKPWREHRDAEDLFIYKNEQNHFSTEIICSNRNIPNPPCEHEFFMTDDMKLIVYLQYSRQSLPHWRKIERQVEARLRSFIVNPANKQEISSIHNQH